MLDAILLRLRQPSTYAGLASIAGFWGFDLVSQPWWNPLVATMGAAAGLAAVFLSEKPQA